MISTIYNSTRTAVRACAALSFALVLAGCGGGGGGGGGGVTPIPLGTFAAGTTRPSGAFSPTSIGASASGTIVQLYGREVVGTPGENTTRQLTIVIYGPVLAGRAYTVISSGASGTAAVFYETTDTRSGVTTTTGQWRGVSGAINIVVADGCRISGTFNFNTTSAAGNVIEWTGGRFNITYETPPPVG